MFFDRLVLASINQFAGEILSRVNGQGLLALVFFQVSAFLILLVLYLILYKDNKARFLRYWIAGWTLLTLGGGARLVQQLRDSVYTTPVIETLFFAALTCFLASTLEYFKPGRNIRRVWYFGILGGLASSVSGFVGIAQHSHQVQWIQALVSAGMALAVGLVLWRGRDTRIGHGIPLIAGALLLQGLHYLDRPLWAEQQFYALRMAFGSLMQIAVGIGMVVLILEASQAHMMDLNSKLRRLTLITASSTQTMSVDEVLQEVLQNLTEALNVSHAIVRLIEGTGDAAQLHIRAAVGYSGAYIEQNKSIPANLPWARALISGKNPWVSIEKENAHEDLATRMEVEGVDFMDFVRLPGKEATLGVLGVGNSGPRRHQADEIAFLVNVANLVGLTVQNVRLFEHAAASERQWSYTFDSIEDPILVHDNLQRVVRVNNALASRLKKTQEDLQGRNVAEVLQRNGRHWASCPYCEGAWGKGNELDPSLGGFLLASNSEFHDPSGRRLGVIHVLKDISDRQQAEEKYRSLIENMQEGVFISTPAGRFLDFNDAFLRMLGYDTREELMGVQDIASRLYVTPSDRERLQKLLREHGSVSDFEFQMRRRDGEVVTLLESSVATRDASGKIVAIQGFALDISERKAAEQEIRRRNRELMILNAIGQTLNQPLELQEMLGRALRQIVDLFGTEVGSVFLLDAELAVLRRAAAWGLTSEYSGNFPPTEIPSDLLDHIRASRATVLSVAGLPLPPIFRDFQQKERLEVSNLVLLWSKDRLLGCLFLGNRKVREFSSAEVNLLVSVGNQIAASIEKMLLLDETRRAYENLRRTQEQLLQSEKMAAIGQLISGVAHELNNPLTAILGYSQLLASSEYVNDRGAEFVGKLHKQAHRTHRIVNNLLSFARQQKPERLPVRVNQVVEDTLALREYDLRVNNIQIHCDLAQNLPLLGADANQLQQVFLNILNNAVDAILEHSDRGDIWIRTTTEEGRILIEFVDSGLGIQDTHRVFDPFYTTKPVGKGTGLGLSICYGIISEHGGEISVQNVPPRGAAVHVTLSPLPPASLLRDVGGENSGEIPAGARVLIVDDEETVLELEKEILATHNVLVLMARNGREALHLLERERVDLIVTDTKMPGEVSGRGLYEWVCVHKPEFAQRIIFTMSDAQGVESVTLQDQTGCPHIQKPFKVETFWLLVRRALVELESATLKR
ncbi:MAG: PAS domain S-box protein [Candidatus Acidiferrales bacterium]